MLSAFRVMASTLCVLSVLGATAIPSAAAATPRSFALYKDSRHRLALLRANGESAATLLVLTELGAVESVERSVHRLGGEVRLRNDAIGYLRVRLPIERVAEFIADPRIVTAAVDVAHKWGPRGGEAPPRAKPGKAEQAAARAWPPRLTDYPLQHPYSALSDVDAEQFLGSHPTWDGRGVTIALIDGLFDPLLPELQQARSLDGKPQRKLADVIEASDPREDSADCPAREGWVDMHEEVSASQGTIRNQGRTYRAPHDGRFRWGNFAPCYGASTAAYFAPVGAADDEERDFAVLWDEASNEVWVDVDRNRSFVNDPPLTVYAVHQEVGVFGADDPETPVRETIAFTVRTDRTKKVLAITLGLDSHAAFIAGSMVGSRGTRGRYEGIAPGAQIISIPHQRKLHALAEGLIRAFEDSRVDIIVFEQVADFSDHYLLRDPRHLIALLAQRLLVLHGKPMFVPASNAPGVGLVMGDGLAPLAFSVGGYQSAESYRVNFGFLPARRDNLHYSGLSHGPSGTGAFKPDVLAPAGLLGGFPAFLPEQKHDGLYRLPPGYFIGGGTSQAAPIAAGAAALLISAAKQAGVAYDIERLRSALLHSARFLPAIPAHEQGHGLIQVGAAWERLQQLAHHHAPPAVEVAAPVRTVLSRLLDRPDSGVGLYEREGWQPGSEGIREITLTRTSGPKAPMRFVLEWHGNNASFNAPPSVTLPLRVPVKIAVRIRTEQPGAHSAWLVLREPGSDTDTLRVPVTVVAALPFTAENGYATREQGIVPRPGDRGFFVSVPAGTAVMQVKVQSEATPVKFKLVRPDGHLFDATEENVAGESVLGVERPMAGVWEIVVKCENDAWVFDPLAPQPVHPPQVTVLASIGAADVQVVRAGAARPAGSAALWEIAARNRLGTADAAIVTQPLASTSHRSHSILPGEQHIQELTIPPGTQWLWARVDSPAAGADLDLYVFDCTGVACVPNASGGASRDGIGPDSSEWVGIRRPAAGRWVVVVDGFRLPARGVEYEYSDGFVAPQLGGIQTNDTPRQRQTGEPWTTRASVWAADSASAGRTLTAAVQAVSSQFKVHTGYATTRREFPAVLGVVEMPLADRIAHRHDDAPDPAE